MINTDLKKLKAKNFSQNTQIDTQKKEEKTINDVLLEQKDNEKRNIKKEIESIDIKDTKLFTPKGKNTKGMEIEISDDEKEIKIKTEKELEKIELKNDVVIRLVEKDNEKFIDFCKFYKGYPTKKNIRIKYDLYVKLNKILI